MGPGPLPFDCSFLLAACGRLQRPASSGYLYARPATPAGCTSILGCFLACWAGPLNWPLLVRHNRKKNHIREFIGIGPPRR